MWEGKERTAGCEDRVDRLEGMEGGSESRTEERGQGRRWREEGKVGSER